MSKQLIALVHVAVLIDGVRSVIEPGEPVPPLHPHDERELLRGRAIGCENEESDAERAQRYAQEDGEEHFAEARQAAELAHESTQSTADSKAGPTRRGKTKE